MRTLSRLWRSLERMHGLAAIPAFWDAICGPDVALVRPHLRVTDIEGSQYPCPDPWVGVCPRRVVNYGNGEYAALCGDPHERCERVQLTRADVLVRELDLAGFTRTLAPALGVQWRPPVERGDGIWAIGLSNRRQTKSEPVFIAILPEAGRFEASVHRLLLSITGPFVLVAPTDRNLSVEVRELLQRRGVEFLSIEEQILMDEEGHLVAASAAPAADAIEATPVQDRRRRIKEFTARNKCKIRDIQEAAGVDEADYYKWLNGRIPDHYSSCIGIERILVRGALRTIPQ